MDRGLLPAGGPAEAAERLIERLERPARVALLGLPGSGKSAILNLLAGIVVVPETLRLPTIVVQHGPEARMVCTLADGRTEVIPGTDLSEVLRLAPALVTIEMDLPALKVITLLEVSAGPMEAEQRRATAWAQKRADIVIWCTTSYLPKEQAVWEDMPDVMKDNGFLFLTKVDLLGGREAAQGMLERVELRAGEEFRQVLAISAKQARQAMQAPGGLDREMFRESGAGAVISAIKTRVQMARRADMDMAELLLARHVEASEMVTRRFAETEDAKPAEWVPPPEAPPEVPAQPAPEPEPEVLAAVEDAAPVLPEPEPEPEPTPLPEEAETREPEPAAPPPAEPAPEPEPVAASRKRFAERIRQVPAEGAAAQVPLRSTWKSKAEATAAPPPSEPEPEPVAVAEPVAEPAPEAAPVAAEPEPVAAAPEPAAEAEPVAQAEAAPEPETDDQRIARMIAAAAAQVQRTPRERKPRDGIRPAATPAPAPAADGGDLRARLFGSGRGAGLEPGSPLPDLSSLRARPEEMTASEEMAEEEETEDAAETAPEPAPEPAPATDRVARLRAAERIPQERVPTPPITNAPVVTPRESAPPPPRVPRERTPAPPITNVPMPGLAPREPQPAEPVVTRRERPRIARAVVAPAPVPAAPVAVSSSDRTLLDEAIALIEARAAELGAGIDPEDKAPVDLVLEHGRETTEKLLAILSRGAAPALRRIAGDLGEVQDLIMLMQLEKGHAPADDALTLLLQLRRELETLRAA